MCLYLNVNPCQESLKPFIKPFTKDILSGFNIVEEAKSLLDKGNRIFTVKKDPERALKYFNDAFRLRPCEESILAARSRCMYTLGDIEGAILDCSRIIELNRSQSNQLEAADPFTLLEQLMDHADGSGRFYSSNWIQSISTGWSLLRMITRSCMPG